MSELSSRLLRQVRLHACVLRGGCLRRLRSRLLLCEILLRILRLRFPAAHDAKTGRLEGKFSSANIGAVINFRQVSPAQVAMLAASSQNCAQWGHMSIHIVAQNADSTVGHTPLLHFVGLLPLRALLVAHAPPQVPELLRQVLVLGLRRSSDLSTHSNAASIWCIAHWK